MNHIEPLFLRLDAHTASIAFIKDLSDRTGVRRAYLTSAAAVLVLAFFFIGLGASFFSNILGVLYPTYASFVAIESKRTEDDTQWLTYWVVFASFTLLETFVDLLLYWFPFYFAVKIVFLVYLQLPITNGAAFLYHAFLQPTFRKWQPVVEAKFRHVREVSGTVIGLSSLSIEEPGAPPRPVSEIDTADTMAPEKLFGAPGMGGARAPTTSIGEAPKDE